MLRLLLLSLLFVLPLQSIASNFYTVNIAVYKNVKTLNKKLDKLPPALRNTIQIEKRGGLHKKRQRQKIGNLRRRKIPPF